MHLGTDEAGKGPVLGSMFVAAVRADPDSLPEDVVDSKQLTPDRRTGLDAEIRDCASDFAVVEVPVERIDDTDTNMNDLTVSAHARALAEIADTDGWAPPDSGTAPGKTASRETPANAEGAQSTLDGGSERVFLDAADTNAVRFEQRVADAFEKELGEALGEAPSLDLHAEHSADEAYPIVSAASIVAKVARDAHVETLATEYGEVGSGYPGDETTRGFLESYVQTHGQLPECARQSWQTSHDVLAELGQSSLQEF